MKNNICTKCLLFLLVVFNQFTSQATCTYDDDDFIIEIDRIADNATIPCITVTNVNYILEDETVVFRLISPGISTTGSSIVWKVNGTPTYSSSTFPLAYEFVHAFSTYGTYTIECEYTYSGSCTITQTIEVEVHANTCGPIEFSVEKEGSYVCIGEANSIEITGCNVVQSEVTFYCVNSIGEVSTLTQTGTDIIEFEHLTTLMFIQSISVTCDINGQFCNTQILSNAQPVIFGTDCWSLPLAVFADPMIIAETSIFANEPLDVFYGGTNYYPTPSMIILGNLYTEYSLFLNGTHVTSNTTTGYNYLDLIHTFPANTLLPGMYELKLLGGSVNNLHSMPYCTDSTIIHFEVLDPDLAPCFDCSTFKPKAGEEYWISAWVKEDHATPVLTYADAHLRVDFDGTVNYETFYPSGEIIDGWQRIVGQFTIPGGTTDLSIQLKNDHSTEDAFFDDIRIHPFNASMKSYVYDPITLLLTAELDDNNYATFYEYDYEGKLIRIKKETARGIMTIQESRSSNPKTE